MRPNPSFTAETVALQRSFESHRPPSGRLFTDPYADAFLRPALRTLARASAVPGLRLLAVALYDAIGGPGPRPSAIVRTKIIDDAVTEACRDHPQCVVLGAGYDTRAHRLPALARRRVFEVDHPVTQTAKRAVIDRLGLERTHITYVAVDFERDELAAELDAAGFDRSSPTLFIWEGVTNYLTREAVESTLAVIRGLAPRGTFLIVTYVDARALDDPSPFPEARRWVRTVARAGEPWTFGLLPADAEAFFSHLGFELREDISTFDASQKLLATQRRRLRGSALYRIAIVVSSETSI